MTKFLVLAVVFVAALFTETVEDALSTVITTVTAAPVTYTQAAQNPPTTTQVVQNPPTTAAAQLDGQNTQTGGPVNTTAANANYYANATTAATNSKNDANITQLGSLICLVLAAFLALTPMKI